ncbi:uncharacterized protein LOC133559597 [Nerophis ophidion]|uniref:uncharacterized protein LOC133559597 n=1 Tax=Nerophis ophidion TaxID=159077 RepID=UPI002ADF5F21|nr:uncharacterized protein LOC133559597 [Nerophis ophidion]
MTLSGNEDNYVYQTSFFFFGLSPAYRYIATTINFVFNFFTSFLYYDDVIYYGKFKNRTTPNTVSGELKISGVGAQDGGKFTLELNKVSQRNSFIFKIISPVPKPQIHVSPVACSKDSVRCKLHCGGDTSEAEPVTFQWSHNPEVKTENITIDVINQEVKSFSCFMTNPISQKESEPFANPFYQEKDNIIAPGGIAGLVIMFLVVVEAAVGGALA